MFDRNETHNTKGKQAFRTVPLRVVFTAGIRCRHRFAMPRRGRIAEPASGRFLFLTPRVETSRGPELILASINPGCNGYG